MYLDYRHSEIRSIEGSGSLLCAKVYNYISLDS